MLFEAIDINKSKAYFNSILDAPPPTLGVFDVGPACFD